MRRAALAQRARAAAIGTTGGSIVEPRPRPASPRLALQPALSEKRHRRGTPRVAPPRRGASPALRPLTIDPAAQESVRLSSLSEPELRSVKPATLRSYGLYDAEFRRWTKGRFKRDAIDIVLLKYVSHLLACLTPTSAIEGSVSAVLFFACTSLKCWPRLQRAVRGARLTRPHRSRIPLAEEIVAAIAAVLIAWGLRPFALLVLLSASAYLRPGEARALRVEDVLPPSRGQAKLLQFWSLFLAPEERGLPTKTGLYDETIYLDHPPCLGEAIGAYSSQFLKQALLFPFPESMILRAWKEAAAVAGVEDAVLYQLRHAGASGDLLSARRTLPSIEGRGRWKTSASVKRYTKSGQVQRSLAKLSKCQLAFATAALANRDRMLLGVWSPRPDLVPEPSRSVRRLQQDSSTCILRARNFGVKEKRPPTPVDSCISVSSVARGKRARRS